MRILSIIQCTNLGGMEQSSLLLLKALQERGHKIQLISLNPLGELGALLEQARIPARGLNYGNGSTVGFMRSLRSAIRSADAEATIMIGHNLVASVALVGAAPRPRLMSLHFHHEGTMSRWRWWLIYASIWFNFDRARFVTDYIRNEAQELFPRIASKSFTLGNPFLVRTEVDELQGSAFRRKHGIPLEAPLVGNAGWLIDRKRFDVFIETAHRLLKEKPDAWFVIAGDGPLREDLRSLAEKRGLSKRLIWTGWQRNLDPFYNAIDVLLFNSDFDALGRAPLEAMAFSVPAVASVTKGGLREIMNEDIGWIFPEHNIDNLTRAVLEALGPEGKARVKRARGHLREIADPHRIAQIIEENLTQQRS